MTKDKEMITVDNVVDRYAGMVYRLSLSQMKNSSDAEDIFQEVLIRLVMHVDKLESWEHVKAWLRKVTINCARKYYHLYWNKNVSFIGVTDFYADETEEYMPKEEHPVRAAVGRLPSKYREVVYLFYYEQFSVAEISEMTRQKGTTVKSQLFRARVMLKKMLEENN